MANPSSNNGVNQTPSTTTESNIPGVLYDERFLQLRGQSIVDRLSNMGSTNPSKGPAPRSLFYEGATRQPDKYGNFLFYSFGNGENDFMEQYYRSENAAYNKKISSVRSKNPSASFLVQKSMMAEASVSQTLSGALNPSDASSDILGGLSAPYKWKDFLYCKHYGTIPNNYMVTLRRFPTPMKDNLSLPTSVKESNIHTMEGAGRPVAQAITWWGGDTGNKLSDIISFSTGLNFGNRPQEQSLVQDAFSKGLFSSPINLVDPATLVGGAKAGDTAQDLQNYLSTAAALSDPNRTVERAALAYNFRDSATEPNGPLTDFIFVSVDTISNAQIRERGLSWTKEDITLTFEYDLTSVGEVNTKAAIFDIMANLLSIGTNYGQFLAPEIRYNNAFPAIGFPGGDAGLNLLYTDPVGFVSQFGPQLEAILTNSGGESDAAAAQTNQAIGNSTVGGQTNVIDLFKQNVSPAVERLVGAAFQAEMIEKMQLPLSFLSGAPIGEWHLVVGNPCNPVAMIGNLICTGVKIDFSERLGPDDFPAELKATFTMKHGRDRERGEIESMFNRGDGRLYQSTVRTFSNTQSEGSRVTVNGDVVTSESAARVLETGNAWTQPSVNNQNPGIAP